MTVLLRVLQYPAQKEKSKFKKLNGILLVCAHAFMYVRVVLFCSNCKTLVFNMLMNTVIPKEESGLCSTASKLVVTGSFLMEYLVGFLSMEHIYFWKMPFCPVVHQAHILCFKSLYYDSRINR
jgi:hypothetical protein